MSGAMEPINTPLMSCFVKMLEAEGLMSIFHDAVNNCDLIEINTPELGLLTHALTTMGFPEGNSADFYDPENPDCYNHPDCFCRDWLYDQFQSVALGGGSVVDYIRWAQSELHRIRQRGGQ